MNQQDAQQELGEDHEAQAMVCWTTVLDIVLHDEHVQQRHAHPHGRAASQGMKARRVAEDVHHQPHHETRQYLEVAVPVNRQTEHQVQVTQHHATPQRQVIEEQDLKCQSKADPENGYQNGHG